MRITGFIWIEEVLDKLLRKHDVQGQEVVEVFDGNPKFRFVEKGNREGETRLLGHGPNGRGKTYRRILRLQKGPPGFASVSPRHDDR
jgi:hypothetical protein